MFSALKPGNIFYIKEHEGNRHIVKVGSVVSVTPPQPVQSNTPYSNPTYGMPSFNMETIVDVRVRCGEETYEFKKLPSNLSLTIYEGLIVSDNRDAMFAELESQYRTSKQVLDSIPYHEGFIESSDDMFKVLNPDFAKKREQEEKIALLENKITGIEGTLGDITTMLTQALNNK